MYFFDEMINVVWITILLILIIVLVLIIINIISDFKNYGSNLFTSFKKYDTTGKLKSLVIDILKKELKKDLLIMDRNDNYFIAVTKYGVFSIQLAITYDGFLKNRKLNDEEHRISLSQFLDDKLKLDNEKIAVNYIIVKDNRDFNYSNDSVKDVISIGELSYKFYEMKRSKVKYTLEDINSVYNRLDLLLNGNN